MDEATAIHEAGHAWAYHREGKPLRYVTIRPREAGVTGVCRPWKPRRLDVVKAAWIASAGPVAEAMWFHRRDLDDEFEWEDHLNGAVLAGGHDDLSQSMGMLDSPDVVTMLRGWLESDWPRIERLADRLCDAGTVSGRDAFGEFRHV